MVMNLDMDWFNFFASCTSVDDTETVMKKIALALMAALSLAGVASAQPMHLEPSGALVFPLFDSRPQSATVINVTNTEEDRTVETNQFLAGDVRIHYVYYGKNADGSTVCLEFDRFEFLTPADTISVIASEHNPEGEVGFLTVTAQDPESGDPLDENFLIGSAYVANAGLDIMWCYTPYSFQTNGAISTPPPMNFDDSHYDSFPREIFIDSFFEEEAGVFENQLSLMSTSGQDYINEIDVFTYNNKEDRFSRTFKFVCHTTVALSEISSIVTNLGGDPNEFAKETGWMKLRGRTILDLAGNSISGSAIPAILGVFVQIVRSDFTAGHALHYNGSLNTRLPVDPS